MIYRQNVGKSSDNYISSGKEKKTINIVVTTLYSILEHLAKISKSDWFFYTYCSNNGKFVDMFYITMLRMFAIFVVDLCVNTHNILT